MLEPINYEDKIKETPASYAINEKEFLRDLELSDKQLMQQFNLQLDGKELTEDEAKNLISYLRSYVQRNNFLQLIFFYA